MIMPRSTSTLMAAGLCVALSATLAAADTITLSPRVTIPVGKWAEGLVFDGSSLWVAESGQRTIAQIGENKVIRRIEVGRLPVDMLFDNDGAIYALVQTDKRIWEQFPRNTKGRAIGNLDGCPQGMTTGDSPPLFVLTWPDCSSDTGRVIRVDPKSGARSSTAMLGEMSQAIFYNGGKVWVAHSRGQALSVVDPGSMSVRKVDLSGVSAWALTGSENVLYVGGRLGESSSQGVVVSVDPATMRETHRQVVDQNIAFMTDDHDTVVAVSEKGRIYVFAANTLQPLRTIDLTTQPLGPRSVMILGDDLYISNGQQFGENGAVLIVSNWKPTAAPPPSPPAPAPTPPGPTPAPSSSAADCPSHVTKDAWMYQNPDEGAQKVIALPAGTRGLVPNRCLANWCNMTYQASTGWMERQYLQADCN
jgi:DNA-binding beta-propeller fold protein YncE